MNVKHALIKYETHIQSLYPMGRAVTNKLNAPQGITAPPCFNLRSIACHNADTFKNAVHLLEAHNKFCCPSIDIYGNILAGESSSCYSIGTVEDDDQKLLFNLKHMKCNKCKMENNLPPHYRMYINSI